MPAGIPVGTLAIGRAGAINAALLAAAVLALNDDDLADRLDTWREEQTASVARSLRAQVRALVDVVSAFTLSNAAAPTTAAARPEAAREPSPVRHAA